MHPGEAGPASTEKILELLAVQFDLHVQQKHRSDHE